MFFFHSAMFLNHAFFKNKLLFCTRGKKRDILCFENVWS